MWFPHIRVTELNSTYAKHKRGSPFNAQPRACLVRCALYHVVVSVQIDNFDWIERLSSVEAVRRRWIQKIHKMWCVHLAHVDTVLCS